MPTNPTLPHQVYILRSNPFPQKTYIGYTTNFTIRLANHNRGHSPYTSKFLPWRAEVVISFPVKATAQAFEEYLESHSGKAFSNKRLLSLSAREQPVTIHS